MNTFGEWYNPLTWFDDSSTSTTVPSYTEPTAPYSSSDLSSIMNWSQSPFGWNPYVDPTSTLPQNDFWAFTQPTTTPSSSTSDIFGGIGDFFSGLTQNLPGLVNLGLSTWQGVEKIIAQQNPADKLVTLPGSNVPVVQRTQGGQTSYYPITQLYPNLAPQVQQAQKNSWVGPVLIAGVLGLGLVLILKKK